MASYTVLPNFIADLALNDDDEGINQLGYSYHPLFSEMMRVEWVPAQKIDVSAYTGESGWHFATCMHAENHIRTVKSLHITTPGNHDIWLVVLAIVLPAYTEATPPDVCSSICRCATCVHWSYTSSHQKPHTVPEVTITSTKCKPTFFLKCQTSHRFFFFFWL